VAKSRSDLRTGARRRADMETDPLVDDTELNGYINDAIRELYAIITSTFEDAYLASNQFIVSAGNFVQNVPTGFWKARGLDRLEGSRFIPVKVFSFRERNRDEGRVRWRVDASIRLSPEDRAAGTYRFWYYPIAPQLATDGATLDAIMDEWSQWIEIHAAIACLTKAQLSTAELELKLQQTEAKIRETADNRQGEPDQAPTDEDETWPEV
jgi:hypothetical protein